VPTLKSIRFCPYIMEKLVKLCMPLSLEYQKVDMVYIEAIITAPNLILAKVLLPTLLKLN